MNLNQTYNSHPAPRPQVESAAYEPVKKRMRVSEERNIRTTYVTSYNGPAPPNNSVITEIQKSHDESQPMSMLDGNKPSQNENSLLSEGEFQASLGKPDVTLQIRIPNDPSQIAWNFYGQILSMTVHVMTKIKDVKSELSRLHLNGMPPNKIQLRETTIGFLKDGSTLASNNLGPTATVEMIPKTRGGRK